MKSFFFLTSCVLFILHVSCKSRQSTLLDDTVSNRKNSKHSLVIPPTEHQNGGEEFFAKYQEDDDQRVFPNQRINLEDLAPGTVVFFVSDVLSGNGGGSQYAWTISNGREDYRHNLGSIRDHSYPNASVEPGRHVWPMDAKGRYLPGRHLSPSHQAGEILIDYFNHNFGSDGIGGFIAIDADGEAYIGYTTLAPHASTKITAKDVRGFDFEFRANFHSAISEIFSGRGIESLSPPEDLRDLEGMNDFDKKRIYFQYPTRVKTFDRDSLINTPRQFLERRLFEGYRVRYLENIDEETKKRLGEESKQKVPTAPDTQPLPTLPDLRKKHSSTEGTSAVGLLRYSNTLPSLLEKYPLQMQIMLKDLPLESLIQALPAYEMQVNDKDQFGRTPIFYAIQQTPLEHFAGFMRAGMDYMDAEVDSKTTELIRRHDPIEFRRNPYHQTNDLMEALVRLGANLNAVDYFGHSPLSLAIKYGDPQLIRFLVENGANPNLTTPKGSNLAITKALLKTPASNQDPYPMRVFENLQEVVRLGANPNLNGMGQASMDEAIKTRRWPEVLALSKLGVAPSPEFLQNKLVVMSDGGVTLLSWPIQEFLDLSYDRISRLRANDQEMKVKNPQAFFVLMKQAEMAGDKEMLVKLVRENVGNINSQLGEPFYQGLEELAKSKHLSGLRLLIESDPTLLLKNATGAKMMQAGFENHDIALLRTVAKRGVANIPSMDFYPLHLAVEFNNIDLVRDMLESFDDPQHRINVANQQASAGSRNGGLTPLDKAIQLENGRMIQILLDAGAQTADHKLIAQMKNRELAAGVSRYVKGGGVVGAFIRYCDQLQNYLIGT